MGVFQPPVAATIESFYGDQEYTVLHLPGSSALAGSDQSLFRSASLNTNPANLVLDSSRELTLSYGNFLKDVSSSSVLSYIGPADRNAGLGISLSYILVPDIDDNSGLDTLPDGSPVFDKPIPSFTNSFTYLRLIYARRFAFQPLDFHVGSAMNAKRKRLYTDVTGYGISFDAGMQVTIPTAGLTVGLLLENFAYGYTQWSDSVDESSYPHCYVSAAWSYSMPYIYGALQLSYKTPDLFANDGINSYSYVYENEHSIKVPDKYELYEKPSLLLFSGSYGFQYTILNHLALRIGYRSGSFGFGAGVYLLERSTAVDLAYINTFDLAGTYQLSVTYRW